MNTRIRVCVLSATLLGPFATPAWSQGSFGADSIVNYQQLVDYDFRPVNPPAGMAVVRVVSPVGGDPVHNYSLAQGHVVQGGPTRALATVQGFETAVPPPGPGDFTGLAGAGSVWNAATWIPTSDTKPPGTQILIGVEFKISGRLAVGHLSDDPATPDVIEGIVPNPMDIHSVIDVSLAHQGTPIFEASATLDAVNGFSATGPWASDFITASLAGIETRAHWVDTTKVTTPVSANVGQPVFIDVFMMATANAVEPKGVKASADFWHTATYTLRPLDAQTQAPLTDVDLILEGPSSDVGITSVAPETNNLLRLTWEGATNDVRILHSPTLPLADWDVIATPDSGDTWTVHPSNDVGYYLLRVGDP